MSRKPSGSHNKFADGSMKDLLKWLADNDYQVERTKGGHLRVAAPDGWVVLPSTPRDFRSVRNAVSLLRRYGVPL